MPVFRVRSLNVRKLKKYCYRFEETCKKMQGVNVQKVVMLLLTIFNSSDKTSQGSHFWDNFYVCATQQAKDIKKYFYQIYKIWDTVTTAKKKSKAR